MARWKPKRKLGPPIVAAVLALGALTAQAGSIHYETADWSSDAKLRVDSQMYRPLHTNTAESEMEAARWTWNSTGAWFDFDLKARVNMATGTTLSDVPVGYVWITDSPSRNDGQSWILRERQFVVGHHVRTPVGHVHVSVVQNHQ